MSVCYILYVCRSTLLFAIKDLNGNRLSSFVLSTQDMGEWGMTVPCIRFPFYVCQVKSISQSIGKEEMTASVRDTIHPRSIKC